MTSYYLSNAGSDSAAGTSPETAWATISRLNTALATGSIGGGDEILFRRGDLFHGSPTHSGHFSYPNSEWITYGAYGTGPKPRISCYKIATQAGWQNQGNSVWRINLAANSGAYTGATTLPGTDVGHIRVDGIIHGVKRNSVAALDAPWDFYSGDYAGVDTSGYLYVRSATNPSAGGRVVEIATQDGAIINVQRHRTIIQDLELYGGDGGIYGNSYWAPHDLIVRRCDIHSLGGGYLRGYQVPTRGGNGIQAWIGNTDWDVHSNRIWDCYDVATTLQGPQGVQVASNRSFERIDIHHNIIWNNCQSFEVWSQGTDGEGMIDCSFRDNLCFGAGRGWGQAVRPDPTGRGCHILIYDMQLPTDIVVERNVFFDAATNYIFALHGVPAGMVLRDNRAYLDPGTLIQTSVAAGPGQRPETIEQAAAYVAATGREQGTTWYSDREDAEAYLAGLSRSGRVLATTSGLRVLPTPAVQWPAEPEPGPDPEPIPEPDPFAPDDVADLDAWWRADAITGLADNDLITTWPDSGPGGYAATAPNAGARPRWRAGGGKPFVEFGGGSLQLNSPASTSLAASTIFVVARPTGTSSERTVRGASGPGGLMIRYRNGGLLNLVRQEIASFANGTAAASTTALSLATVTYASGGAWTIRHNRAPAGSGTDNTAVQPGRTTTIGIAGSGSLPGAFQGAIAEIIVYRRILSAAEIAEVETYLAEKHAIT